jgi:hypothetical protein
MAAIRSTKVTTKERKKTGRFKMDKSFMFLEFDGRRPSSIFYPKGSKSTKRGIQRGRNRKRTSLGYGHLL